MSKHKKNAYSFPIGLMLKSIIKECVGPATEKAKRYALDYVHIACQPAKNKLIITATNGKVLVIKTIEPKTWIQPGKGDNFEGYVNGGSLISLQKTNLSAILNEEGLYDAKENVWKTEGISYPDIKTVISAVQTRMMAKIRVRQLHGMLSAVRKISSVLETCQDEVYCDLSPERVCIYDREHRVNSIIQVVDNIYYGKLSPDKKITFCIDLEVFYSVISAVPKNKFDAVLLSWLRPNNLLKISCPGSVPSSIWQWRSELNYFIPVVIEEPDSAIKSEVKKLRVKKLKTLHKNLTEKGVPK